MLQNRQDLVTSNQFMERSRVCSQIPAISLIGTLLHLLVNASGIYINKAASRRQLDNMKTLRYPEESLFMIHHLNCSKVIHLLRHVSTIVYMATRTTLGERKLRLSNVIRKNKTKMNQYNYYLNIPLLRRLYSSVDTASCSYILEMCEQIGTMSPNGEYHEAYARLPVCAADSTYS